MSAPASESSDFESPPAPDTPAPTTEHATAPASESSDFESPPAPDTPAPTTEHATAPASESSDFESPPAPDTPAPTTEDAPPPTTFSPPATPSPLLPTSTTSNPSPLSPPSTFTTPPSSRSSLHSSSSSNFGTNYTGIIAGAAGGAVAVLLVLGVIFFCCFRWKKKRTPSSIHNYDNPYGGVPQDQNWQQDALPSTEQFSKMRPNAQKQFDACPPYLPGSTKPPIFLNNSGGSTSNCSGFDRNFCLLSPGAGIGISKSMFTYDELARATNWFSDANLLGQGGFGYVHIGILPNGKEVAVKQMKAGSGQGEREFLAEVEVISRVHHRHLVALVGYCIEHDKRLLVYEYVPNGPLQFHLHGKGQPPMDWSSRLRTALGSAKGLAYLHEDCHPKIIHRDIKAANILLDDKFEAKVADFGLAKFAPDGDAHVSTRIMGTFGYLAPEFASSGKLTDKSDVFSFGVMLLELITGRRPFDSSHSCMEDSIVHWSRPLLSKALEDGDYDALVDLRLGKDYNSTEMARMIGCAAACVRHSSKRRPRMSQVVRALEGVITLDDLNEGVRPFNGGPFSSHGSSDYESSEYIEDLKKSMKMALASQTYASSEYSGPSSEHGQNSSASSTEHWQRNEMEMGRVR